MNDFVFDRERFLEWNGKFILSIQIGGKADLLAAQEVVFYVRELTRVLKGAELVPRSLLNELNLTVKILHAEIPYLKSDADKIAEVASEIQFMFDLILCGESFEDRVAGVPRIV